MNKYFLLTLGLLLISCSTPPPRNSPTTTVPFELFDNRIFVNVMLNGQGPFKFMFDTGSTNVLTPTVAQRLKLSTTAVADGKGAGNNPVKMWSTDIQRMQIGDIQFNKQDFLVLDLSEVQRAFNMPAFDGTFGYEVLMHFLAYVDFERQQLMLTNEQESFDRSRFYAIPFHIQHNDPVIDGKIEGLDAKILIDTGDRSSLSVFRNFLSNPVIAAVYEKSPEIMSGYGAGGPIPAKLGYISALQISPNLTLQNVISRHPTTEKGFNALPDLNASIGNEILKQFNIGFDYRNKILYLQKNNLFGKQTQFTPVPNPNLK